jgi:hypothetical protein
MNGEPQRTKIDIELPNGSIVSMIMEGTKLVGVTSRIELAGLIAKTPLVGDDGKLPVNRGNVLSFFGKGPCPFPGCEELRAAYEAEKKLAENGGCTDCKKSGLIQKYIPLVTKAMTKGGL